MSAVGSRRRSHAPHEEGFGLLEIARALQESEDSDSALPPGKRDASGFWFPAAYRAPVEMFTPRQRSMQAKQRVIQRTRRDSGPAAASAPLTAAADAGAAAPQDCETALPLPAPMTDAVAACAGAQGAGPPARPNENRNASRAAR